jgi:histidine phosphotransfer protein HptB
MRAMEQPALVMDVRQLEKLNLLQDDEAPNLVAEMASGFLARTPRRLGLMRELLVTRDLPRIAHEAHGLATASGMFGMMRLRMYCKALENLARGSRLEELEPLLCQAEQSFTEARPLLMAQVGLRD